PSGAEDSMARKTASGATLDWSEFGRLLIDLERGLSQLSAFMAGRGPGGGNARPHPLAGTVADNSAPVRTPPRHNRSGIEDAARMGQGALRRLEEEVAARPLVALAIAAGIGFVIGALNRRSG